MAAKQDKAAAKAAKQERKAASKARRGQIFQAFNMQRKEDKALIPLMVLAVLVVAGVFFGIGWLMDIPWLLLPIGVALGLLAAVVIFGRRVQRNVFAKAEGQPGAAGWALDNLRGRWKVTQAVAATTQLDVVHRVIGRAGIVLVAEGAPHRVKPLLAQEKKRVSRLVAEGTPIYDVVVGNEEGQIPLKGLHKHVMKLPNNLRPAQIDAVENRLAALAARGAAMPKGPMPQGARMRSVQRAMKRR